MYVRFAICGVSPSNPSAIYVGFFFISKFIFKSFSTRYPHKRKYLRSAHCRVVDPMLYIEERNMGGGLSPPLGRSISPRIA